MSIPGPIPGLAPDPARMAGLARATEHLDPPYAVVNLEAFDRNADALVRRAGGMPIRVASKSIRVRALLDRVLARPGFAGVLAFTLPEALFLAQTHSDIVVGYPTADRGALRRLVADPEAASRVAVMVDCVEHLDLIAGAVGAVGADVRVCLDLDASYRAMGGRVHLGPRRSPVHTPTELRDLALEVVGRPGFRLAGVMSYEGQIAGLGDNAGGLPRRKAMQTFQRISATELRERRALAIAAVREVADLDFVNAGGTGSLELTSAEPAVTDVAAGSGLLGPVLFDHYTRFRPEPAAFFVLSVVRRPGPRHATVLGGGWIASGPTGADRQPTPYWPAGLRLIGAEAAGEVQTPLAGKAAASLDVGDRVWFRHAKSGELCEHVAETYLVQGGTVVQAAPTYRGEGFAFL